MLQNNHTEINTLVIPFLSPGFQEIRKSIKGIDDSYNNQWDLLAELLQNAVDAIRQKYLTTESSDYVGQIYIYINAHTKEIKVKDNGIGISKELLPTLLKPFSSNKEMDAITVGEKGVGLTFALFNSNEFRIKTGNEEGNAIGIVYEALNWKNSQRDEALNMEIFSSEENVQGTEVVLKDMEELALFELSDTQLEYLIRTKTAVGNTKIIWEEDININVNMDFIDANNTLYQKNVPFKYYLLPDYLDPNEKIGLSEFNENYSNALISDRDRRAALLGKVVYEKGTLRHNGNRIINYYSYFVPTRQAWNDLNISLGLLPEETENQESFYYALLNSGIYTAVKGMPTGISINSPTSGNAGYWANMFIIFQDNRLNFDIGRKSIHGSQAAILKQHARTIFNEYAKIVVRYGGRSSISGGDWDRDEIFDEIEEMRDMNYPSTSFKKYPTGQEAQVCAMFYEQIGRGTIQNLTLLTSGYKGKYDLYAKWGARKVVIEYKSELKKILKDFNDEQKLFDEINCIVCWDVSEGDADVLHSCGINLSRIEAPSRMSNQGIEFPNATHKLELSGFTHPIYVIDLKIVIENVNTSTN